MPSFRAQPPRTEATRRPSRRGRVLVAAGLLALAAGLAAIAWRHAIGPTDDAYIALRYSKNLARGLGFVFNAGERVEGFTSPLWVVLCALAYPLGVDPVGFAMALAGVSGVATLLALAAFPTATGPRAARLFAPALLVATTVFAVSLPSAADASLFAACVTGACLAYARADIPPRPASAHLVGFALAGVAMVLARPEGAPLAAWFLAHRALRVRGRLRSRDLPFAAPLFALALLLLWRRGTFGEWFPNTYFAKAWPHTGALLGRGARYLAEFALLPAAAGAALGAPFLLGNRRTARTSSVTLPALALLGAVVAWNGGDHYPGHRLLLPALPIACHATQEALFAAARRLASRPIARPLVFAVGLFLLAASPFASAREVRGLRTRMESARNWARIGKALRGGLAEGELVAVGAAGAIPFWSEAFVLDIYGLLHPEIAKTAPADFGRGTPGHEKANTEWVLARRPSRIFFTGVLADAPFTGREKEFPYPAEQGLRANAEFRRLYEPRSFAIEDGLFVGFFARREGGG